MAVNNNFYATMNELMSRATSGTIAAVVDYDTFIDAGKVLADMEIDDLKNGFLSPLMNKVQKTILDTPSYAGSLTSMYAGRLDYGLLEIIMGDFYDVTASVFDGPNTLVDGQEYTDQFIFHEPKTSARYYSNSDSFGFDISIRDTDLRGAFTSPAKMDSFIRKIFLDVANSNEFHKELNRLAVVAGIIKEVAATSAEQADENAVSMHYDLLAIYNAEMGTTLTAQDALLSNDFVTWSVGVIRDVKALMAKPSKDFNVLGEITTFTPAAKSTLKINSVYDKAIRRSLVDAYNQEYGMIQGDYEVLPYWQNSADRLRVTTNATPAGEEPAETTYSPYVLALLMDDRACGEMQQLEEVDNTRNARRKYTTYHYAFNYMYWTNLNANTVIFTLGSAQ